MYFDKYSISLRDNKGAYRIPTARVEDSNSDGSGCFGRIRIQPGPGGLDGSGFKIHKKIRTCISTFIDQSYDIVYTSYTFYVQ